MNKALEIPDNWIVTLPQEITYANVTANVTGHGLNSKLLTNPYDYKSVTHFSNDGSLRFTEVTIMSNQDCISALGGTNVLDKLVCVKTSSPDSMCDVSAMISTSLTVSKNFFNYFF